MQRIVLALIALMAVAAAWAGPLPGTAALTESGDLAAEMVGGIDAYLAERIASSVAERAQKWRRDFSSPEAYEASVAPNREQFKVIIGAADPRLPVEMEQVTPIGGAARVGEGPGYSILAVRWPVLEGVYGEGLLLQPEGEPAASVVALPDCDWTPETLCGLSPGVPEEAQFARRLAERGCRVIVPALIDRRDTFSGNPDIRMTNQPHREFIYRAAFEMGHHIIGYEVQKVSAAAEWLRRESAGPVGVIGCGEGGLIALYAAAADLNIDAAVVSGYFQPREQLWREPIYSNVWALLDEFGDAELATLVAPRALLIDACAHPEIAGPPPAREGRNGAAPGILETPPFAAVQREYERARELLQGGGEASGVALLGSGEGLPGNAAVLNAFLKTLGISGAVAEGALPRGIALPDADARMKRQFDALVAHTQQLMRESPRRRAAFWSKADTSSAEAFTASARWYREYLWDEIIGRFPAPEMPLSPRTRQIFETPAYTGYEVMLDVYPGVFASGILLAPKGIAAEARRPVVVCQHGLEGTPRMVADPEIENESYHQFGCRLAEKGYVVYAPQNPYIGGDAFRVLQRKANPLKKSLFGVIVRQHERTLEWLASLPVVDPERIAFYGLSYGGKTAMRVPALLEQYCLSICSGDYNEWIWKNGSADSPLSYLFTGEYEMFEFNLGNTYNYAEMSWLIFPRPFMVERGHNDGVSTDEWVAYEYAKTRRRYDLFELSARTEIEYFNGPHTIHGAGTFAFLDRWLKP